MTKHGRFTQSAYEQAVVVVNVDDSLKMRASTDKPVKLVNELANLE